MVLPYRFRANVMSIRHHRKGVAAVELALFAPVLCLIMLGMLEAGRALQVQMALTNAVREGCRGYCDNTATVTLNGQTYTTGTSAYAIALVQYCLINANVGVSSSNINSVTVTASTSATVTLNGISFTPGAVTATVPYSLVAFSPAFFFKSRNLSASLTMRKP
jgi:Flp pilus assembly protein TadG